MADDSRGWVFQSLDYIGFSFILVAVEECVRSLAVIGTPTPWRVWLAALVVGLVFMWFGHTGPKVKAKLLRLVRPRTHASDAFEAALAENAKLKAEVRGLENRIEALKAQPSNTTPSIGSSLITDKRIVNASPDDLLKFFRDHVSVQALRLLEPYLGQWMMVSEAEVINVNVLGDGRFIVPTKAQAYLFFNADWKSIVSVLKRGSRITVIGQIKEVSMGDVHLENCELVAP